MTHTTTETLQNKLLHQQIDDSKNCLSELHLSKNRIIRNNRRY